MKLSSLNRLRTKDENRWLKVNSCLIKENKSFDTFGVSRYLMEMSISDKREVYSLLIILISHKLKSKYQSKKKSRSWDTSIFISATELENIFKSSKTLYNYTIDNFNDIYTKSVKKAVIETGLSINDFPSKCEWTINELLDTDL
jgi:hypothetical protein